MGLEHLADPSTPGLRVAAADKLHNARATLGELRATGDAVWARFNAGREEQLWFYRSVVTALRESLPGSRLVDALDDVVCAMERLPSAAGVRA